MLQLFGLVVDFGPVHSHHLHQEKLNQSVASQHERGEFFTGLRQADTRVRFVPHEAGFRECLDHGRGGPGDDAQRGGELPHRHQPVAGGKARLGQQNGLQVVLDCLGRQHDLTLEGYNYIF